MKLGRTLGAIATATIVLSLFPLAEGPWASADTFSERDQELFRAQNHLLDLSDVIESELADNPDYSTISIDPEASEITVWWQGSQPSGNIKQLVEDLSDDTLVKYRVVDFSEEELMTAGAEISRRDGVYGVRVSKDMSGLEVIPLASDSSPEERSSVSLSNSLGVPALLL